MTKELSDKLKADKDKSTQITVDDIKYASDGTAYIDKKPSVPPRRRVSGRDYEGHMFDGSDRPLKR